MHRFRHRSSDIGKSSFIIILLLTLSTIACNKDENSEKDLVIIHVNDSHGQLENFAKLAPIISAEEEKGNVLVLSAGDMFSGNPVVDNHPEKGYPMIDLMNRLGFDAAVLGNHEFDYGEYILDKRIEQSAFPWVCANVETSASVLSQPPPYKVVEIDGLKIIILGLLETNGKPDGVIPSTHPWKIENLTFKRPEEVIEQFTDIKEKEDADLMLLLSHMGAYSDIQFVHNYPFIDFIVGGHSHALWDTLIEETPVIHGGSNLHHAGIMKLVLKDQAILNSEHEHISLSELPDDPALSEIIDNYNNEAGLDDVIGYSEILHTRYYNVGCFYTDAMRAIMKTDLTIQNRGGVRNDLDEGPITKKEIYSISPFNNGTVIYEIDIATVKQIFSEVSQGLYFSGLHIYQSGQEVIIEDEGQNILPDDQIITLGVNDYIPAVYDYIFPQEKEIQPLSAAETLIAYLLSGPGNINYPECNRFFKYQ